MFSSTEIWSLSTSGEGSREESRIGGDAGSVRLVKAHGAAAGRAGVVEGGVARRRRACALRREPGAVVELFVGGATSP